MQEYGPDFAKVYNLLWAGFSSFFAPVIHNYLGDISDKTLLDLCCGTGQLSNFFLEHKYQVTGLDLSSSMLEYARKNNQAYIDIDNFHTIQADAKAFTTKSSFSVVISLYDALNHLENEEDLRTCFQSVSKALKSAGVFIFDLNTKYGLKKWSSLDVQDEESIFLAKRGLFVEEIGKAYLEISGFIEDESRKGIYRRFREMIFNTCFEIRFVIEALKEKGFHEIELRRSSSTFDMIEDPEKEARVFFVCHK